MPMIVLLAGHYSSATMVLARPLLLQCLARMRPVFNRPPDDNSGPTPNPDPVEPELAGEKDNEVLDALARSIANSEATLKAQLSFGVPLKGRRTPRRGTISTQITITRTKDRFTGFHCGGKSVGRSDEMFNDVEEPLLLAYGAGRHPKTTTSDNVYCYRFGRILVQGGSCPPRCGRSSVSPRVWIFEK